MIVKYSEHDIFELTDEEFEFALVNWNKGTSVFIPRLKVSLSPFYRWAGIKPDDPNKGYAREDKRPVFLKFGEWRFVECPELTPDLGFYKSLAQDNVMPESEIQKQKLLIAGKQLSTF